MKNETSLNAYLDNLLTSLSKKSNVKNVVEDMKSSKIQNAIKYYLRSTHDITLLNDYDKQNIHLIIQITQYLYSYTENETGLSDMDYDALYELYINLGYSELISVGIPEEWNKTGSHTYTSLRGSLDKIYYLNDTDTRKNPSRKRLSEWVKSKSKSLNGINLLKEPVTMYPKWDGVSCVIEFDEKGSIIKALTRGDVYKNIAKDVTHIIPSYVKSDPELLGIKHGEKYEVMMSIDNFNEYNRKYDVGYMTPLSITSSILNSDERDERAELLTFIPLRYCTDPNGLDEMTSLMQNKYPSFQVTLGDEDKINEYCSMFQKLLGNEFRMDGAVFRINSKEIRDKLGRDESNYINNYEVAYKYTEEVALTKLIDVVFKVGSLGDITPVASVEPIMMKGKTITNVSLGSVERFCKLHLCIGDTVKISYDIIPYLTFDEDCKHSKKPEIEPIAFCPSCKQMLETDDNGYFVRCINPECDHVHKGRIINFLRKIGCDGIGEETIDTLYEEGFVRRIPDLFILKGKRLRLEQIHGFGKVSVENLLNTIDKNRSLSDYVFLGAIGINGVGIETFRIILHKMDIEDLIIACYKNDIDKLCTIQGIKEKKAQKIIDGMLKYENDINDTIKFLNITHPEFIDAEVPSVCFTGFRNRNIENEIINRGGIIHTTLKKNTKYLCVPNSSHISEKTKRAETYGVEIIPMKEILNIIEKKGD